MIKSALPYTPGRDGAGDVEAVGAEVTEWKKGDRVYLFDDNSGAARTGTYAEQMVCAPTQMARLPEGVSYAQGAAIGVPYHTAYYALFTCADSKPGETVLVHGASGGVGHGAVQAARAHGMRVIGTAGTERGLRAVEDAGAHVAINHHADGYVDQILKATNGRGVDVILEMNAHLNLDKDLTLVAMRGRIVIIGSRGQIEIDPRMVMMRESAVLGMVLFNIAASEFVWMDAAIGAGLTNRTIKPLVGRELPLAEAPAAHEAVMAPGALGKIVLVP
jgi:NADPH2:quinone reductase